MDVGQGSPLPLSPQPEGKFEVVVLLGPIGSGKTTVAQEWLRTHPDWAVVNFADLLRKVVNLVYNIPVEDQKVDRIKNQRHECLNGNTLRFALQWLGTEGFRTINPDTWTEAWLRTVSAIRASNQCSGILVEDCRFYNEFQMADAADAYFIPIYHDKISKSWEAQLALASSPKNQLKLALLQLMPWLSRFGVRAHTIHESERQRLRIEKALLQLPPHRVLPFDNSTFDASGELIKAKVHDLYAQFVSQSQSQSPTYMS